MALAEAVTGAAMIAAPDRVAWLLLGASLDSPAAATVARVCGLAMASLALACWLARDQGHVPAGRALITAMLLYNAAVAALLVHGKLAFGLDGVSLWPAALAHVALGAWCVRVLYSAPERP
jgi:hypothetical protein